MVFRWAVLAPIWGISLFYEQLLAVSRSLQIKMAREYNLLTVLRDVKHSCVG